MPKKRSSKPAMLPRSVRSTVLCLLIAAVTVTGLAGCDVLEPSDFKPEIVVNGFLEAGGRFPNIRINRTGPIEGTYEPDSTAVRDANVEIHLLAEDGSVEEIYTYEFQTQTPGWYQYVCTDCSGIFDRPPSPHVLPLRTYRLIVEVPGEPEPIVSETTVPDTMIMTYTSADSIVYQSDDPFTFRISRPSYPGRQSVFVFSTLALDGHDDQLTPFAKSLVENNDNVSVADLRESVSPILNEENFDVVADGSLEVKFPWLAINFYGRNRVSMIALDDNLYNFIRSQSTQQGGSTRPPGEIPNVLDPVDGGRGIFGSYARASAEFVVLRRSGTAD